jgi:RimJ/RimL family protein N-acetyltransferase
LLRTDTIRLLPHTPEHLRALLEGSEIYERRFGILIADGVREFLIGPEVSEAFLTRLKTATSVDPWRDGFGVLHLADNTVIGFCSYNGPPDVEGMVEISYGIAPGYRGRGYATEAARLIIAHAHASGVVRTLQGYTLPEHNASTKVLTKCGFTFRDEVMHPSDGLIWRWELRPGLAN